MNEDKLERIWKQAIVAYSKHYPRIFLKGLRETAITSITKSPVARPGF
jgi:hypothetical protein